MTNQLSRTATALAGGGLVGLVSFALFAVLDNSAVTIWLLCATLAGGLGCVILLGLALEAHRWPPRTNPEPLPTPPPDPDLTIDYIATYPDPDDNAAAAAVPAPVRAQTPTRASMFDPADVDAAITQIMASAHRPQPAPEPLPPLEPWNRQPAPWDDVALPAPEPLSVQGPEPSYTPGPLLPRRPATPDEYDAIAEIYAETQSLNATIRRVYGIKDGRTHGWVKEALQL